MRDTPFGNNNILLRESCHLKVIQGIFLQGNPRKETVASGYVAFLKHRYLANRKRRIYRSQAGRRP